MSIKGSTVNQKVFSVLSVLLKFEYNIHERYFFDSAFSNTNKPKSISDTINLIVPETAR